METISITDMYMNALSSLSNVEKLDLISKLTDSMLHKKKKVITEGNIFSCFHTDWGGNESPEKIADDLRKNRMFNRDTVSW